MSSKERERILDVGRKALAIIRTLDEDGQAAVVGFLVRTVQATVGDALLAKIMSCPKE